MANAVGRVATGAVAATRAVGRLGGAVAGLGGRAYGGVKTLATGVGVLATAFGVNAVRASMRFQEQLEILNTVLRLDNDGPEALQRRLGGLGEETRKLGRDLREIAMDRGVRLTELTDSYYEFVSAGIGVERILKDGVVTEIFHAEEATKALTAATNFSIGALASQAGATRTIAFALNAYNLNSMNISAATRRDAGLTATTLGEAAEQVSDYFSKAVEIGVVTGEQIAATFATVAASAKSAGIGIDEIAAAYASQTVKGISAAKVTVSMNRAIQDLMQPGKKLIALQEKLRISFADIARDKGLQVALQEMRDRADALGISYRDLFKRQEGWRFALNVTGADAPAYLAMLESIRDSTKGASDATRDMGAAALQAEIRGDTLARNITRLQESFLSLSISVGDALLKPLNALVKGVTVLVQGLDSWAYRNRQLVETVAPLAGAVALIVSVGAGLQGFLLVFSRLAPAFGATATNLYAVQKVIAGLAFPIALLVGVFGSFILLVNKGVGQFGQFQGAVEDMAILARSVGGVFRELGRDIGYAWGVLRAGGNAGAAVDRLFSNLARNLSGVGRAFERVVSFIWETALSLGRAVVRGLQDALPKIGAWAVSVVQTLVSRLVTLGQKVVDALAKALPQVLAGLGRFIGEVADNLQKAAPTIFRALGQWTRQFVDWVRSVIPVVLDWLGRLLGRIIQWIQDAAPTILRTLGEWLTVIVQSLGDILAAIVPVLARAAGLLIDWIAAALPEVLGAIARFIDGVVRGLVPLGESNGPVAGAMSGAGQQLVSWITDRLPGAIDALTTWASQVITWIVTVFIPRLVVAMVGAAAALAHALVTGFFDAMDKDAMGTATKLAQVIFIILTAAAVLNAGKIAGFLVSAAFSAAMIAGKWAANAVLSLGQRVLAFFMSTVPMAAAAGAAASAAFLAAAAALGVVVVYVVFKLFEDIGQQASELRTQVKDFASTATLEGLYQARDAIKTGMRRLPPINFGASASLAGDLKIVNQAIKLREMQRSLGKALDSSLSMVGIDPSTAHSLFDNIKNTLELNLARETWKSLQGNFNDFLKGTFGLNTSDIGQGIDRGIAILRAKLRAGEIVLRDGVISIVERTEADIEWGKIFSQGPNAVQKSASDYESAYQTVVEKIVAGQDSIRTAIEGLKEKPFKSDKARIKELQGLRKEATKNIGAAIAAGDTTSAIAWTKIRDDVDGQITALKGAKQALAAQTVISATGSTKQVSDALDVLKLKTADIKKLTALGEIGQFGRDVPTAGLTPPSKETLVNTYYAPFRTVIDQTSEKINTLPGVLGTAAIDAASQFITNAQSRQTEAVTSVTSIFSRIGSFLSGLMPVWFLYGSNLVQSLIDGILGKTPQAAGAGESVALATSTSLKAWSPPRVGPLRNLPKWGASYVTTLADAITSNLRPAEMAGYAMAGAVAGGMNAGPRSIVPITPTGGRFGGGGGYGGGIGDREMMARNTELLGQIAANSSLAAAAAGRQAANDPMAGGPLAARGTLSALRHLSHGE